MTVLLVGFLGGSVLNIDLGGMVKGERATSGVLLLGMIGRSIFVSGPFILQISCGTIYKIA